MYLTLTHSLRQICITLTLVAVLFASVMLIVPRAAAAQDVGSLSLEELIALVQKLQAMLSQPPVSTGAAVVVCPYTWTRDLAYGDSGPDVKKLQQFLNETPETQLASIGIGSPGNETDFYGELLYTAVSNFQIKYRRDTLSPLGRVNPTGSFAGLARSKANELCSSVEEPESEATDSAEFDKQRKEDLNEIAAALEEYHHDHGTYKLPGGYKDFGNGWFARGNTPNYTTALASVLQQGGYLDRVVSDPSGVLSSSAEQDQSGYMIVSSAGSSYTLWANLDNPTAADVATMDSCASSVYDNYSSSFPSSRRMNYCVSGTGSQVITAGTSNDVAVSLVSTQSGLVNQNDAGEYSIRFEVTAINDDVFIGRNPNSGKDNEIDFEVQDSHQKVVTNFDSLSSVIKSSADSISSRNVYVIHEGDTETFTLTVVVDPIDSGMYRVGLKGVSLFHNIDKANFRTEYLNILGGCDCGGGSSADASEPTSGSGSGGAANSSDDQVRKTDLAKISEALDKYYDDHGTYRLAAAAKASGNGWFSLENNTNYQASAARLLQEEGYLSSAILDPSGVASSDATKDQSGYMIVSSPGSSFTIWANLDNPTAADRATLDTCVQSTYDGYQSNWPASRQMNYCVSGQQGEVLGVSISVTAVAQEILNRVLVELEARR